MREGICLSAAAVMPKTPCGVFVKLALVLNSEKYYYPWVKYFGLIESEILPERRNSSKTVKTD